MTTQVEANGTVKPKEEKPNKLAVTDLTPSSDEPRRALSAFASESSFVAAQRIAHALASSSLVPEAYKNNLPNVLIAMELANRIGLSVLAVMQSLNIIQGKTSWSSQFLIATVNSSGKFTPMRFRFQGKEGTDEWGCRAWAKDKEYGDECVGPLITLGMAKKEGWATKNGSKWISLPEIMLGYRAAAFWVRLFSPELSLGMHTAEEVQDTGGLPPLTASTSTSVASTPTQSLEDALLADPPEPIVTADGEVVESKAVAS